MRTIPSSELIINDDGSIFHLHLKPEQLADTVLLVGDPARVEMVASYFDNQECRVANREFVTITGTYKGKRMSVISTGIGTDNIDIVVTELDALANIDFTTRQVKPELRQLTLVRLGTSGAIQPDIKVGTAVFSRSSVGFDGLLNYYKGRNEVCDLAFEEDFCNAVGWNPLWAHPYVIDNDADLVNRIDCGDVVRGVTISANGFYGPQGRELRAPLADPNLNAKIQAFKRDRYVVTNYEMESSALAGLAALLGHKAMTVCLVIANRVAHHSNTNYKSSMGDLIVKVLDRI